MDDKLLDDVGAGGPGTDRRSRGSSGHQPGSSAAGRSTTARGRTGKDGGGDGDWSWTKRLRLQRHSSFGNVDEDRSTRKDSDKGR